MQNWILGQKQPDPWHHRRFIIESSICHLRKATLSVPAFGQSLLRTWRSCCQGPYRPLRLRVKKEAANSGVGLESRRELLTSGLRSALGWNPLTPCRLLMACHLPVPPHHDTPSGCVSSSSWKISFLSALVELNCKSAKPDSGHI